MKKPPRGIYFKLDENKKVIPVDTFEETYRLFEDPEARRVSFDDIGPYNISTVFLGIPHGIHSDEFFETMVFPGCCDDTEIEGSFRRYNTWDDAKEGHAEVCNLVRRHHWKVSNNADE